VDSIPKLCEKLPSLRNELRDERESFLCFFMSTKFERINLEVILIGFCFVHVCVLLDYQTSFVRYTTLPSAGHGKRYYYFIYFLVCCRYSDFQMFLGVCM
jgi:hypothetical protein